MMLPKLLALMISMLLPILVIAENNEERPFAHDTGVRGGNVGAGSPMLGLDSSQYELFAYGKQNFEIEEKIANGLGPRFNLDSCGGCHAYSALGGSSPATNPQIAVATAYGAKNTIPAFLSLNGPIRVVRFVNTPEGKPDGEVHGLFVISGRNDGTDASDCNATQEDFAAQAAKHNLSFRIPTPLFGLGLIEQITDNTLEENLGRNHAQKQSLGIAGHFNKIADNGTIGRFGWKAQHASMVLFSSEAYNAEMGLTNSEFPLERDKNPTCQLASSPKKANLYGGDFSSLMSLTEKNAYFMRNLAPPTPSSTIPGGNDVSVQPAHLQRIRFLQ